MNQIKQAPTASGTYPHRLREDLSVFHPAPGDTGRCLNNLLTSLPCCPCLGHVCAFSMEGSSTKPKYKMTSGKAPQFVYKRGGGAGHAAPPTACGSGSLGALQDCIAGKGLRK